MIPNIPPKQSWEALTSEPNTQLVDVRTDAEWNFVGLPDLTDAGKQPVLISWQVYPTMQVHPSFTEALLKAGLTHDDHIYFICRSGARSMAAAQAAAAAGFKHVFNVAEGFEGDVDARGHRGTNNGWKAASLPWRQR